MPEDTQQQKSLRRRIVDELELTLDSAEHRRKRGLETTALREVKGREHYLLSAEIIIFEEAFKKLDEILENVQLNTARSIRESKDEIGKIRADIEEIEGKLSQMVSRISSEMPTILTRTNAEVINTLKDSSSMTIKSSIDVLNGLKEIQSLVDKTQEKIENISKELNAKNEGLKQEIQQSGKLFVGMLKENISALQNFFGGEIKNAQSALLNEIKSNSELLNKNSIERDQTAIAKLNEISKSVETLVRTTEDNFEEMTRELFRKMDEFEKDWKKYLETEIKSLRDLIGSIRGDVEMQKHMMMRTFEKLTPAFFKD